MGAPEAAAGGETLLHLDLRADNLLLSKKERVLVERYPQARRDDPDALTAVVAPVAGFFTREGLRPVPARLPNLWAFQAAQGEAARSWLARRTGLKQVLSDSAPLFTGVRRRGVLRSSLQWKPSCPRTLAMLPKGLTKRIR